MIENAEYLRNQKIFGEKQVVVILGMLTRDEMAFGIRRNQAAWKNFLDNFGQQLLKDGQLTEIINRHFPKNSETQKSE